MELTSINKINVHHSTTNNMAPRKTAKRRKMARKGGKKVTYGYPNLMSRRNATEVKQIDTSSSQRFTNSYTSSTPGAVGNPILLNWMSQGSSATQHVGRKAVLKSLLFRWQVVPEVILSTQVPDFAYLRILIVYDRQSNGVYPTSADILNGATAYTAGATVAYTGNSLPLEPMNLNNRDRFKVLLDKKMKWNRYDNSTWTGEKYIKLKSREMIFQASSGSTAIGDITTGAIHCLPIVDITPATNANWTLRFSSRVRFVDA